MGKKQKTSASESRKITVPAKDAPKKAAEQHPQVSPLLLSLLPKIPPRHLEVNDLVPATPHGYIAIPNFLTRKECQSIVSLGDQLPWETVAHPATREYASRDNDRIHWADPALSRRVWTSTGLAACLATLPAPPAGPRPLHPVGLNTGWRLYRYRPGQHFGAHYDDSVDCADFPGAVSLYTMLVYLNDDFQGGETNFYRSKGKPLLSVAPVQGLALLHTQGPLCALHEGAAVAAGCKWLLRTDVMYAAA